MFQYFRRSWWELFQASPPWHYCSNLRCCQYQFTTRAIVSTSAIWWGIRGFGTYTHLGKTHQQQNVRPGPNQPYTPPPPTLNPKPSIIPVSPKPVKRAHTPNPKPYSRSPKVGNPMASILKSLVKGIPALFGLNPVSNFLGLTVSP